VSQNEYNVCFLNRYDHQKHQLNWHSDSSPEMDTTHPIAVVSFGVEREIWFRAKGADGEVLPGVTPPEERQKLGHGSLFVMPPFYQDTHMHRIPRCDHECGIRISLTFRKWKNVLPLPLIQVSAEQMKAITEGTDDENKEATSS
jgi:alkylated DNA repair dioxygenase AlkB